jgi:hypothetical protein
VVALKKKQLKGALRMQMAWRKYQARLEFWRRWRAARERFLFDMAARVQKVVRRFLAMRKLPALLLIDAPRSVRVRRLRARRLGLGCARAA